MTMGAIIPHPAMPAAPAAILRTLSRFDRPVLESFITVAIELLDMIGGDPDLEQTRAEDDWFDHRGDGPGCPISDPGGAGVGEDDEDDDPAGQCDEDGVNTRCPGGAAFAPDDLECGLTPDWGIDQTTALPEAIVLAADREGMHMHRDRIRATRCVPEYQWDWRTGRLERSTSDFQLIDKPTAPTQRQLRRRKRGVPRRPRG